MSTQAFEDIATFLVGERIEIVLAKKSVLATKSSVFKAMFYGELKESCFIEVPDCEAVAFRCVVQNLDAEKFEKVFKKRNMNGEDIHQVIYVAEKYLLSEIKSKIVSVAISKFSLLNIVEIYKSANLFEISDLKDAAIEWMLQNLDSVLKLDSLLSLEETFLEPILKLEECYEKIEPIAVFHFVKAWLKHHSKSSSTLLKLVRLDLMSATEINAFVKPTNLFTIEELYDALVAKEGRLVERKFCAIRRSRQTLWLNRSDAKVLEVVKPKSGTSFVFSSAGFVSFNGSGEMVVELGKECRVNRIKLEFAAEGPIRPSYQLILASSINNEIWTLIDRQCRIWLSPTSKHHYYLPNFPLKFLSISLAIGDEKKAITLNKLDLFEFVN